MTCLPEASAADVLGVAGILVAVWATLPQLLRIVRHRSVAGVSVAALANGAVSQLAWTGYSLWLGDLWLLSASVVALPGALGTAWVGWRASRRRADLALPAVWAATLAVAAFAETVVGWRVLAFVVGGSIAWLVLPSVVKVWRSTKVHAVAAGMWWLLVVEAGVAIAYGSVTSTTAPVVFGLIEGAGALAVLLRLALAAGGLQQPGPRHRAQPGHAKHVVQLDHLDVMGVRAVPGQRSGTTSPGVPVGHGVSPHRIAVGLRTS